MRFGFKHLFNRAPAHSAQSIKIERQHILTSKTPFATVEEYKALRTNILFSSATDGCRVIGVTSCLSSEGKSITCLNLAITFAETDARVLIIDCDLRKPKISRLVNARAIPGVSNVLVGMNTVQESIQPVVVEKVSFDVLLSGDIPPNPSELLGSSKMKELIESLRHQYDYILVDTPPVGVVADAAILSSLFTGFIVVVRAGSTHQEAVHSGLKQLKFAGANVLGVVLNGMNTRGSRKTGGYRAYNYTHAQSESQA